LELGVTLYYRFQLRTIIPFLESVETFAIGGAPHSLPSVPRSRAFNDPFIKVEACPVTGYLAGLPMD
jgi:hypothetical protein